MIKQNGIEKFLFVDLFILLNLNYFSRDLIKSIGFFGLAVYLIRDFAANDLIPME